MKSSSSDATSVDKASYRLRKTWSGAQCESWKIMMGRSKRINQYGQYTADGVIVI